MPSGGLPAPLAVLAVVAVAVSPWAFVVIQAVKAGPAPARALLERPLARELIWNTIALTSVVMLATAVIGFTAAYLVERTDLPLRRAFAVALVMPLAVPEFVQGFSWVALTTSVRGYWGAVLVMSCSLYPLVYLPVAATLRGTDPAMEEAAHSLGSGRLGTLWRVTIPVCRPAIGAGALLVGLYLLGEYGAFAALRFRTFATAIFTEYQVAYDTASASVLTLILCALALIMLGGESRLRGQATPTRVHGRGAPRVRLGLLGAPAALLLLGLLALAIGVPVAALVYWFERGNSSTLPAASVWAQLVTTTEYAGAAAVLATMAAVPVALYSWRRQARFAGVVERVAYLSRALPGIAVGLSMIYFTINYARPFYAKPSTLVVGYVVLFFPLALTGVRASLATVSPAVEEVARSLGAPAWKVLARVTLPLVLPGLGVAAALVMLSANTELTATLLLRPIGTETLATQFWKYTSGLAYGAAAPYAAVMIAISVIPVVVLAQWGRLR